MVVADGVVAVDVPGVWPKASFDVIAKDGTINDNTKIKNMVK